MQSNGVDKTRVKAWFISRGSDKTDCQSFGLQTVSLSAVLIGLIRIDNSIQTVLTMFNVYRIMSGIVHWGLTGMYNNKHIYTVYHAEWETGRGAPRVPAGPRGAGRGAGQTCAGRSGARGKKSEAAGQTGQYFYRCMMKD